MRIHRIGLSGLATAIAIMAVCPSLASASIAPALTLDQSKGTSAGTTPYQLGLDLKFNPSTGDTPKDVSLTFPAGLLANADLDGGACLAARASAPPSACMIGAGTATVSGASVAASAFLVAAPKRSDVAGIALQLAGTTAATADVTLRSTPDVGLDISFTNLPKGQGQLSELNLMLTSLRLPSSCPSPAANVGVSADSYNAPSSPQTAQAPLSVTGCSSLRYAPSLSAAVTKTSSGADVSLTISQAAGESASKSVEVDAPASLKANVAPLAPCVTVAPCTVGTASAASPLVPAAALAHGTATLGGTLSAPTITVSFPAPFALSITGAFSPSNNSVTFSDVPDIPLTSLSLKLTGTSSGAAFTTTCAAGSFTGKFAGQGGQAHTASAPIVYHGCGGAAGGAPAATGSVSGLGSGHPKLKLEVKHGPGPKIASISIGVAGGLKFSQAAVTCAHGTKGCRVGGLSVSGGRIKSAKLSGGRLVITLSKPVASVSFTAGGPVLAENKTLRTKASKRRVKSVPVSLRVTDANHRITTIALKLKVK